VSFEEYNHGLKINPNLILVGACGAAYPVIPLAKAQRTQREEKRKGKVL